MCAGVIAHAYAHRRVQDARYLLYYSLVYCLETGSPNRNLPFWLCWLILPIPNSQCWGLGMYSHALKRKIMVDEDLNSGPNACTSKHFYQLSHLFRLFFFSKQSPVTQVGLKLTL